MFAIFPLLFEQNVRQTLTETVTVENNIYNSNNVN